MLLRLCQLKSLSLILLTLLACSCSWRKEENRSPEVLTSFPNQWFSTNRQHALVDSNHAPVPHLFFDTNPEFSAQEHTVNAIIAVAENSSHAYGIDLNSGQRYFTHSYCKQKDVWNEHSSTIHKPSFSIAFIPRVLDQLGETQKVIVWSKSRKFHETAMTNFHKVRLVGAFVEQICPEGNCLGKNNWASRLVFLGVDAEDPSLTEVKDGKSFKETVDWESAKSSLQNIDGRNFIGDQTFPAVRIGQFIEYAEAYDYFKRRSIFLVDGELKKIQRGCHALYDKLWEEVGKERPEDRPALTKDELNQKIKLIEDLKKKKVPVGFAERFAAFTKKYYPEVTTCEKMVYHGNLNLDSEAFWFLSYTSLFYRLHREGYYFDCRNKSWQRNILNDEGEAVHDLKRDIGFCKEAELDQAMAYLPNFLTGLRGEKDYFRFVDYDNHVFGTHSKMYSWVKIKSRKFDCPRDPNVEIRKQLRLFPEDVSWKQRKIKDLADEMKIIY